MSLILLSRRRGGASGGGGGGGTGTLLALPRVLNLQPGDSLALSSERVDSLGNESAVTSTWSSSNASVATVSGTTVTAVALGTCTLTATNGSDTSTIALTVSASVTVAYILMDPHSQTIPGDYWGGVRAFAYNRSGVEINGSTSFSWEQLAGGVLGSIGTWDNSSKRYFFPTGNGTSTLRVSAGSVTSDCVVTTVTHSTAALPSLVRPAGYTDLASLDGSAVSPTDWGYTPLQGTITTGTDATAPKSPNTVLNGSFPTTLTGGFEPFVLYGDFPNTPRPKTLYQEVWVKLSSNWTNSGNSGTKFGFWRNLKGNHFWGWDSADGRDAMQISAGMQYADALGTNVGFLGHGFCKPGRWHKIETLLIGNTAEGADNGIMEIWVDNRRCLRQTGLRVFPAGQPQEFTGVVWLPTYGGGTNSPSANLTMTVDHWINAGSL